MESSDPEKGASGQVPLPPSASARAAVARSLARLRELRDALASHRVTTLVLGSWSKLNALLARLDPNEDPDAEPLTIVPLIAFGVALGVSVWLYWSWKFQPMQDMGHHVGLSAIVADYSRPGSLYPALYEKPDPFLANSLLYTVAGYSGKLLGVTRAVRLCMVFYVAGVPLANLYALRVFGRSPWAAILAVPLVYNMNYVAGFTNLLFAAPFMVLAIPVFYRVLVKPTWKRMLLLSVLYVAIFLAHAHAFLWMGALGFALTLGTFIVALARRGATIGGRLLGAAKVAGASLICVLPALLLFWRWYDWSFGAGKEAGSVQVVTAGWADNYAAYFKGTVGLFTDLPFYALRTLISVEDLDLVFELGILVMIAIGLSRLHKWKKPPVLELAFALTVTSYFFLPEAIATNSVVGSRQIGVSLWFLAALVSPVPPQVSRLARWFVILGILWFTRESLKVWHRNLVAFEHTEADGLEFVMEVAPYRQRLHEVKLGTDFSKVFTWKPNWHVDKYYMADRFGQVPDNPAIVSTSSIRYREGIDPHRLTGHSPDWAKNPELWMNFELVLVHNWLPTPEQLDEAKKHARRIRKQGDWELWRTHGPWELFGEGEIPKELK